MHDALEIEICYVNTKGNIILQSINMVFSICNIDFSIVFNLIINILCLSKCIIVTKACLNGSTLLVRHEQFYFGYSMLIQKC